MNLTSYQKDIQAAVLDPAIKTLMVVARAGCVKTYSAINVILPALGADENAFFGCFGSRIAKENVEKLAQAKGISAQVDCSTFHSLGSKFLRAAWGNQRLNNFREQNIAEALGWNRDHYPATIRAIGGIAQKVKEIAPFGGREDWAHIADRFDLFNGSVEKENVDFDDVLDAVAKVLDRSKRKDGTISFADMIWLPLTLNLVKPRFSTIVVDECQDLNLSQILLAQKALKPGGRGIYIGDPRQAIFGFRGADKYSMQRIRDENPGSVELPLPVTFRCGKKIVELAQEFVPDFQAHEGNCEGEIAELEYDRLFDAVRPGDAILSRTNAPLTSTCLKLLRKGVKAYIEGRDIGLNLITLVDTLTKKRRSTIDTLLDKLQNFGKDQERRLLKKRNADQLISDVWDKIECLEVLSEGLTSSEELKARLKDLFQDSEKVGRRGKVVLSSIHRAKGLEFDRVFGLSWTVRTNNEEEENLYYVLVTRAKNLLTWVNKAD